MSFAENLKDLRQQRGLKQSELAKILQVTQTTVSCWERGKAYPEFETLIVLAQFFNESIDFLVGLTDEWGNETQPAAKTPANTLTEDEREVIDMYRRITPREQQKVRIALEMYADTEDELQRKNTK